MRISLVLTSFLFSILLQAQNLVVNSSFENYHSCPNTLAHYNKFVKKWSSASFGSPDYFNVCSQKMNIPNTYQGYQEAKFGKGFSGFHSYIKQGQYAYREYIIGTLTQTLIKGQKYKVSFYINLADKSRYAIKSINVLLSQKVYYSSFSSEISEYDRMLKIKKNKNQFNFINIKNNSFYTDKENWILVSQEFIAQGFENFIIIGNFNNNSDTEKEIVKHFFSKKMAYYFIDQVSVEPILEEEYNSTRTIPTKKAPVNRLQKLSL